MAITRGAPGLWMCAGLWLAVAAYRAPGASAAEPPNARSAPAPIHDLNGRFPVKPSVAPAWSIPVENLGFAPPGPLYLGQRNALVSLDFLNEDQILFTFRVPALLHRVPGQDQADEREIRAVVLDLPSGTLDAEQSWMVYDRAQYLWGLHDGHFLLRRGNDLLEGDATLKLAPLFHFPGPLLTVGLDPTQTLLVTNSREPVASSAAHTGGGATQTGPGGDDTEQDHTGQDTEPDAGTGHAPPDIVVRIMSMASRQVLFVSRAETLIRLPINMDGFLASLRSQGTEWGVDLNRFSGGDSVLGQVKSACAPELDFISQAEILATACGDGGNDALVAMNTAGRTLWIDLTPDRLIWPLLVMAPDGRRFARETLYVSHGIDGMNPLGDEDIKGQWVKVLDAASGNVVFESPATPILDAGGNVAISPSGRRVAVLNGGAIEVFELAAPAAPADGPASTTRNKP